MSALSGSCDLNSDGPRYKYLLLTALGRQSPVRIALSLNGIDYSTNRSAVSPTAVVCLDGDRKR